MPSRDAAPIVADLLPSGPDDLDEPEGARVVGVDGDEADRLLSALSSATARELLAALHDDPAPASELADRVDTSIQNASYHLDALDDAGLIEPAGTAYSEKGREMTVYAPADEALVVIAGNETTTSGLRATLRRLIGGIGAVTLGAAVVQRLAGSPAEVGLGPGGAAPMATETDGPDVAVDDPDPTPTADGDTAESAPADGETATEAATGTPTRAPETEAQATETPIETATDPVRTVADGGGADPLGLLSEPGVAFALGGLAALAILWLVFRS